MGISFDPGGAQWAEGLFRQLQEQIAAWEGIDLPQMRGYGGTVDWDDQTPLVPFFYSYDFSDESIAAGFPAMVRGFWSASQCEKMLPRLKALMTFHGDALEPYHRRNLPALIAGMEHCAQHGCAMSYG